MTDNMTNFTDTSDVSDAAIEWVIKASGGNSPAMHVRAGARAEGSHTSRARILAARLIQQHRPDLLVDPVDAIVREELAKAYEAIGALVTADYVRGGGWKGTPAFDGAKRLYLMGIEKRKES